MFLDTADFSGIPATEKPVPLKVSKAILKAFLEVNEEGSEAAAATGMLHSEQFSCICMCSCDSKFSVVLCSDCYVSVLNTACF